VGKDRPLVEIISSKSRLTYGIHQGAAGKAFLISPHSIGRHQHLASDMYILWLWDALYRLLSHVSLAVPPDCELNIIRFNIAPGALHSTNNFSLYSLRRTSCTTNGNSYSPTDTANAPAAAPTCSVNNDTGALRAFSRKNDHMLEMNSTLVWANAHTYCRIKYSLRNEVTI